MSGWTRAKALVISLLVSGGALVSSSALAEVRHVGDWDHDSSVTIDLDQTTRDVAVKRLAEAAGWSLVSTVPPGEPIDIHVRDKRASKVLDLLLTDGDYIATRDGSLLSLRRVRPGETLPPPSRAAGPVPPVPPVPPMAPIPPIPPIPAMPEPPEPPEMAEPPEPPEPPDEARHGHRENGSDREVFGDNLRIEKGETVNDVTVFGGNADVWGTVKGDLVVTGGNVHVYEGARVMGDVTSMGGTVTIDDHARVDGDISTVGGLLRRGKAAEIHGDVSVDDREHNKAAAEASKHVSGDEGQVKSVLERAAREAGDAVTGGALLFVFGAVLLSLMTARMETLKVELASRPMRSFATGVIALLGWVALTVVLAVTIVGIPFALVTLLGGFLAVIAGLSATLETIGGALLGHKTKNPYVHLAFGCGLFLVLGSLPFVGDFIKLAAVITGFGCVATTRGAGFFPAKDRSAGSPYRDVSSAL